MSSVGTRTADLRAVVDDEQLAVLRTLADPRRALGEEPTEMVSQLHHLLLELVPGGAKKFLAGTCPRGGPRNATPTALTAA